MAKTMSAEDLSLLTLIAERDGEENQFLSDHLKGDFAKKVAGVLLSGSSERGAMPLNLDARLAASNLRDWAQVPARVRAPHRRKAEVRSATAPRKKTA